MAFLFPAPMSRRALLVYRIIRSQLGLLFSALVFALVFPSSAAQGRLRTGIAMWILLFTGRLYFTGVSLARARMDMGRPSERRLGWVPAALVFASAIAVGWSLYHEFLNSNGSLLDALAQVGDAVTRGPAGAALWPFTALLAPLFVGSWRSFAAAMPAALSVLVVAAVWVLASDDLFQETASDVAHRHESARAIARRSQFKARVVGVELGLTGPPELVFAWKGMMQTLRVVDRRSVIRLVAIVGALTAAAVAVGRANGLSAILAVFAAIGACFTVLMAPQALRLDLRQDLGHLELLKTWPIAPAALVRGEMLWPAAILTVMAWGLLAIAFALSDFVFAAISPTTRSAVVLAAVFLAPMLILAQYTIHNAVALFFPAWVPLGANRSRGLDAMGQRLILLGGTWLVLAAMTLPGAIAGGFVWLGLRGLLGAGGLVAGAMAAALVIAVEVVICSEALGPVFERVDLSGVERSE